MEYVHFDFNLFGIVFMDGQQLEDTFSKFQACIAQDIAQGLIFLHDNDIAHRNLEPDKILVAKEYYAQLTDEDKCCKIRMSN